MAGVGHMQRISQDVFHVAGTIQVTCSSELFGGQGADFLRGVAFWEHQIFRFADMILCDRCSTLDRWSGKIAERIGMRPSALLTLHF